MKRMIGGWWLIYCLAWVPWLATQAAEKGVAGEVIFVRGNVLAESVQDQATRSLTKNAHVFEGERLITAVDARVTLRMVDQAVLSLGSDTHFTIKRYRRAGGEQDGEADLGLLKGVFRSVTGLLGENPKSRYRVATPTGTIGIRGTDYWAGHGYFQAGKTELALIEGKGVFLQNAAGITVLTRPGTGTGTVSSDQAPSPEKAWPESKFQRALESVNWEVD